MKKILIILLAIFMLAGCGSSEEPEQSGEETQVPARTINIVTTTFPQYDWVREIIGENNETFELTLLVNSVVDFHSYQPSIGDIAQISAADLFIYVGGHSDDWTENAINQATNPDLIAINLVESLGNAIKMARLTEGMEHVCDDECEDDHGEEITELHEEEHVWTSLRNAMILCSAIAEAIIQLNPENEAVYLANLDAYLEKLAILDVQYLRMTTMAERETLVFGDRFPFLYLVDDYELNHYAAFSGCYAASEIAMSTIVILSRKLDDYNLNYIMVTETGDHAIAQTIIDATRNKDHEILVLHGMKAITTNDVRNGVTYLSIMEDNFEVLRKALN
ncbi:MAG: zinc ABC transporter substrate-binding protein [Oscillospiraceae bacterium]|jgi:zinc transport system substrate-binding protein|nr:zinc ABC transporter substrate-binding protein [Oscillospiraceae bacterium]